MRLNDYGWNIEIRKRVSPETGRKWYSSTLLFTEPISLDYLNGNSLRWSQCGEKSTYIKIYYNSKCQRTYLAFKKAKFRIYGYSWSIHNKEDLREDFKKVFYFIQGKLDETK